MSGEGVGTLRAASEEYTRVIISRESRESHKILLYAFGGIGVICVSKLRTLHADVPTFSLLIAHNSLPKNLFLMFFCLILLAGLARFAWVKNLGRCTQTSLLSPLTAHCSRPKNLFFCSSVKNQNLRSSVESVSSACHWKSFTKAYFCINPAGKSKVPSWKIFISQLENYFFPVGKSKFRSRAK